LVEDAGAARFNRTDLARQEAVGEVGPAPPPAANRRDSEGTLPTPGDLGA